MIYAAIAACVVSVLSFALSVGLLFRLAHVEYILALTIEQQDDDREMFVGGRPPRRAAAEPSRN